MDKVIVVGGGLGGLSGAIYLAALGFDVELFEQNESLGGKMNEYWLGNYRFDTGPSLLTMPFIIEELLAFAGFDSSESLAFQLMEPVCRYFWPDGTTLDTSCDMEKMKTALAKLSADDARAYTRYMRYTARIYDLTADIFLFNPIHEVRRWFSFRNIATLSQILKIDPLRTVNQGVQRFFKHEKIIQIFNRYATYNGSDPYRAPATLNIIPFVEYGLGGYYIKGGMYNLVRALSDVALYTGVKIHTDTRVEQIIHKKGTIKGVVAEGKSISASLVLCNVDVVTAHNELLSDLERRSARLDRLEPSLSGLVFLWCMKKKYPELAHHNIIFSADYKSEFEQIFRKGQPPREPTIYIAITSKSDPDHAHLDGENWFVLLNMPFLAARQDWDKYVNMMRDAVLHQLKVVGLDISGDISSEKIITPEDFLRLYGSNKGSIYGISSNSRSTTFRRPPNRSRDIKGIYFAGGSCHPGGGIPLVILSGRMAAQLIAQSVGLEF